MDDCTESDCDGMDGSYDGWIQEQPLEIKCVFCDSVKENSPDLLDHILHEHNFDLGRVLNTYREDFHNLVRLVNYLRSEGSKFMTDAPDSNSMEKLEEELCRLDKVQEWAKQDEYLVPVISDDTLIQQLDDIVKYYNIPRDKDSGISSSKCPCDIKDEDDIYELKSTIKTLSEALRKCQDYISRNIEGDEKIVSLDADTPNLTKEAMQEKCYFETYDEIYIHDSMIRDRVRTNAYKNFIEKNRGIFEDKIVLDVGCGTSILSLFCAKAGASKVFGVDNSLIIKDVTTKIVRKNECGDKVKLIRGLIEEIDLPSKVDIIISEWMGYFLLLENMISSIIYSRDKFLSPGGKIFPSRACIFLAAAYDPEYYRYKIEYWDNAYGLNLSPIKSYFLNEALIDIVNPESIVSYPQMVHEIDIIQATESSSSFECTFPIKFKDPNYTKINSFCGWFETYFEPGNGSEERVVLSTSPQKEPTHWKQTIFLLEKEISLKDPSDTLMCSLSLRPQKNNKRHLFIVLNVSHNSDPSATHSLHMEYTL